MTSIGIFSYIYFRKRTTFYIRWTKPYTEVMADLGTLSKDTYEERFRLEIACQDGLSLHADQSRIVSSHCGLDDYLGWYDQARVDLTCTWVIGEYCTQVDCRVLQDLIFPLWSRDYLDWYDQARVDLTCTWVIGENCTQVDCRVMSFSKILLLYFTLQKTVHS